MGRKYEEGLVRSTWSTCPIIWNEEHFYASLRTYTDAYIEKLYLRNFTRSGNVQMLLSFFTTCTSFEKLCLS